MDQDKIPLTSPSIILDFVPLDCHNISIFFQGCGLIFQAGLILARALWERIS